MRERLKYLAGFVGGLAFGVFVAYATSPMGLTVPVPGQTAGPLYAVEVSDDLNIIDVHDHSPGKGNPVPTAGLNINADLPFNDENATTLRSTRFQSQVSPLSVGTDIGALYESGVDLYYNDGNGTQIQITANGTLDASTFGGFTNLAGTTGQALYTNGTGTFSYTSQTGTSASVTSGPVTIRDVTNGVTKGVTLQSPTSLAAAYALTLPTKNPQGPDAGVAIEPVIMTVDSNGVMRDDASNTGIAMSASLYAHSLLLLATANVANPEITVLPGTPTTSYSLTLPTGVPDGGTESPIFMGLTGVLDTVGTGAIQTAQIANLAITGPLINVTPPGAGVYAGGATINIHHDGTMTNGTLTYSAVSSTDSKWQAAGSVTIALDGFGVAHTTGYLTASSGPGTTLFTLAAGTRPAANMHAVAPYFFSASWGYATLLITASTGVVSLAAASPSSGDVIDLNTLQFFVSQ